MAFCGKCGQPVPDELDYCPHCSQLDAGENSTRKLRLIRAILIGAVIILLAVILNLCIAKGFFGSNDDGFGYEKRSIQTTTTAQPS